jgi:hypothetical protein
MAIDGMMILAVSNSLQSGDSNLDRQMVARP